MERGVFCSLGGLFCSRIQHFSSPRVLVSAPGWSCEGALEVQWLCRAAGGPWRGPPAAKDAERDCGFALDGVCRVL